mmetsp:Transcript_5226/g.11349  ORF Transcript_5226/g.11349 Transcript_5226/m.11349 type:complete len:152 (+) Transcript_5226:64-519(+)
MAEENSDENTFNHTVSCHCGRVSGRFRCAADQITCWDCNCSDCAMRKNIHLIIPSDDIHIEGGNDYFEANTILYLWGTGTAKRRFCKCCGILPWYIPRSNPDGVAITLACVKFDASKKAPSIVIKKYDGLNWEESHGASGIVNESKKEGSS